MKAKEAVGKPLRTADLQTPDDVEQWLARLNRDRPARAQIVEHIVDQVAGFVEQTATATPLVVELCPGAGVLTQALLTRLPTLRLIAIDGSDVLLRYGQSRLACFGDRVRWVHADLNRDEWQQQIDEPSHAIVSMQSLHDVGGEEAVRRLYGWGRERLVAGGLFAQRGFSCRGGRASAVEPADGGASACAAGGMWVGRGAMHTASRRFCVLLGLCAVDELKRQTRCGACRRRSRMTMVAI